MGKNESTHASEAFICLEAPPLQGYLSPPRAMHAFDSPSRDVRE